MIKDKFSNVMTDKVFRKYLSKNDYKKYKLTKENVLEIDFQLATKMAEAIKKWAKKQGATYYTHWFFPLNGKSAEKLTSFYEYDENGMPIYKFDVKNLIKGEADASSFPSGGERETFEARGYTIWDISSPIFIKENGENKVLFIPTAFCSYKGLALDDKTPLLRSSEFLNREIKKCLIILGYKDIKKVSCQLGCEQEYFLIDKNLFDKRPDLYYVGRTLLGSEPILSQDFTHHYFSSIDCRLNDFMCEVEKQLFKMGIIAKVQHNEVAPSQHEIVPIYCDVNVASDQNMLIMQTLNDVAGKFDYKVLFHEKPFKGINGSGKHNNFSIVTSNGMNLLDCEKTDEDLFMLTFSAIISGIDKFYPLLRIASACYGNEERLGGNEAPPSIISIYIGEHLLKKIEQYISGKCESVEEDKEVKIGTNFVAKFARDNCDRNRTSPFAFTGKKFEFRMMGSSQNAAFCNTILQTIIAAEFKEINHKLELGENIKDIVKNNFLQHSRIIFNGNSYSKEWEEEALKRGLVDYESGLDCYQKLLEPSIIRLFQDNLVMTKAELNIKMHTLISTYYESVQAEAKTLSYMFKTLIFPAFTSQNKSLKLLKQKLTDLDEDISIAKQIKDDFEKAVYARDVVKKKMNDLRDIYDNLDFADNAKPMPDYNNLLF